MRVLVCEREREPKRAVGPALIRRVDVERCEHEHEHEQEDDGAEIVRESPTVAM